MKKDQEKILFSPSDLITFVKSPFASWMDRQYLEDRSSLTPDEDDAMLTVLARRGNEHEHRYLTTLNNQGHDVCEILQNDASARTRTIEAIEQGCEVIFQARLEGNGFAGWADFLFKQENPDGSHTYEIWDTKLAKSPKPYFIIQLCCYSEMYEAMTGRNVEFIGVVLGTGERFNTVSMTLSITTEVFRSVFWILWKGGLLPRHPPRKHQVITGGGAVMRSNCYLTGITCLK